MLWLELYQFTGRFAGMILRCASNWSRGCWVAERFDKRQRRDVCHASDGRPRPVDGRRWSHRLHRLLPSTGDTGTDWCRSVAASRSASDSARDGASAAQQLRRIGRRWIASPGPRSTRRRPAVGNDGVLRRSSRAGGWFVERAELIAVVVIQSRHREPPVATTSTGRRLTIDNIIEKFGSRLMEYHTQRSGMWVLKWSRTKWTKIEAGLRDQLIDVPVHRGRLCTLVTPVVSACSCRICGRVGSRCIGRRERATSSADGHWRTGLDVGMKLVADHVTRSSLVRSPLFCQCHRRQACTVSVIAVVYSGHRLRHKTSRVFQGSAVEFSTVVLSLITDGAIICKARQMIISCTSVNLLWVYLPCFVW